MSAHSCRLEIFWRSLEGFDIAPLGLGRRIHDTVPSGFCPLLIWRLQGETLGGLAGRDLRCMGLYRD